MPIKLIPPHGTIALTEKTVPISSLDDIPPYNLIVTREVIDVSLFKAKLLSLPAELWEDEYQHGNVKLHRPAHDKWGIKKIVFVFCDDFMLKILDLPWSSDQAWSSFLDPIYASIGLLVDSITLINSSFYRGGQIENSTISFSKYAFRSLIDKLFFHLMT
jgi:hypothetical protein